MKAMIIVAFLLVTAACTNLSTSAGKDSATERNAVPSRVLNFCELAARPEEFHLIEVEVYAVMLTGFETAFLYDPGCTSRENIAWFDTSGDRVNQQLVDYFSPDSAEFKKTGLIRIRGRFSGTLRVDREHGFGHMNSTQLHFLITDAQDISTVSPETPYPW